MKPKRPVNLDLGTIKFPITAVASIVHRVSGVFLVAAVGVLLYLLDLSLASPEGFARAAGVIAMPVVRLVVWAVLAGLLYHLVAGVRHLLMDVGIGESLQGGILGARLTLGVAGVLIVLAGVWLW